MIQNYLIEPEGAGNLHPRFEVAGLGAMTQLTELWAMAPFAHQQGDLQTLTRLQQLALDFLPCRWGPPDRTTCHPFIFPEAAGITKLRLSMHPEVGSSPFASIGFFVCLRSLTNNLQMCKSNLCTFGDASRVSSC